MPDKFHFVSYRSGINDAKECKSVHDVIAYLKMYDQQSITIDSTLTIEDDPCASLGTEWGYPFAVKIDRRAFGFVDKLPHDYKPGGIPFHPTVVKLVECGIGSPS